MRMGGSDDEGIQDDGRKGKNDGDANWKSWDERCGSIEEDPLGDPLKLKNH